MRHLLRDLWLTSPAGGRALVAILVVGCVATPVMDVKGTFAQSLAQTVDVGDGQPFLFGRWTPDPKGANPMVPRVDRSTIGAYGDLMAWDQFGVGVLEAGRLVSLEEWTRERAEADLNLLAGGEPLARLPVPPGGMRFFMQTMPDVWAEVAADQTAGESLFIRLRMVPDLRTDRQVPVAEVIRQYVTRRSRYHYGPDGRLTAITRADEATGFAPRRISIGPDGGPVD